MDRVREGIHQAGQRGPLAGAFGQRLEECESKPWKEIQEGVRAMILR